MARKKVTRKKRTNAEEGGRPEFWGNDIDGEVDEAWAKEAAKILKMMKDESK